MVADTRFPIINFLESSNFVTGGHAKPVIHIAETGSLHLFSAKCLMDTQI